MYLSRQALNIFMRQHTCDVGAKLVPFPRYDSDCLVPNAILTLAMQIVAERSRVVD
jgi:hypothetical protein